jgi:hypothetical protein
VCWPCLPLAGVLNLAGYSGALSANLDERLASSPAPDDHLAAARMYQNEARELEAEAVEYETAVSKFTPYQDSKGFHRGVLKMAAQGKRYEAKQMQDVYAAHLAQAQALHGKLAPQ